MAFTPATLHLIVDGLAGGTLRVFSYATADSEATVTAANYLTNATRRGLRTGDVLLVHCTSVESTYLARISAIGAAGHGTVTVDNNFLLEYATKAAVQAATVPVISQAIRKQGYYAAGDGGGALYKRVVSQPTHNAYIQSADGAYWELAEPKPDVRMFGAKADGSTNDATAINNAIGYAYTKGYTRLTLGPGTHSASAAVAMKPAVRLVGTDKLLSIIKQADGANINFFIDFSTHTAHGAGLENLTIDGNRDNNATLFYTIATWDANNAVIRGCLLKGSPYIMIYHRSGSRPVIDDNTFDDIYATAILVFPSLAQTEIISTISRNVFTGVGLTCVIVIGSDHHKIFGNEFNAPLRTGLTCTLTNSSGLGVATATVGNFTGARTGMILVSDDGSGLGTESIITSIISSTVVHVDREFPVVSGVAAAWGGGDIISIDSSSFAKVYGNEFRGGVTYGASVINLSANESAQKNSIVDNNFNFMGGVPIGIYNDNTSVSHNSLISDVLIADNQISGAFSKNCGDSSYANAIDIRNTGDVNTGSDPGAARIFVTDNQIQADAASHMRFGIREQNIFRGTIKLGTNDINGATVAPVGGLAAIMALKPYGYFHKNGSGQTIGSVLPTFVKFLLSTAAATAGLSFGSNTVTILRTGMYDIYAQAVWTTNPVDQQVYYTAVYKNGTIMLDGSGQSSGTGDVTSSASGKVLLLVGDTIEMYVGTSNAGPPDVNGSPTQSYLAIEHIADVLS